ncbi:MAG: type IV pili twitching motility protein PilT, partial [Magnetococcales bacterium]|nr:type IV pili twitching motility protein PilT [Magnetococcales bacterium]
MERDQAIKFMLDALKTMLSKGGSDLFITSGFPPAAKLDGKMTPLAATPLDDAQSLMLVRAIMNDRQIKDFDATKECNFAINPKGIGRFRVNAFVQQGQAGMVLRTITTDIPDFDKMGLPPTLKEVVMSKT